MASNLTRTLPDGYLFDTNVFSAFHSKRHPHHVIVRDFLTDGPPSRGVPLLMSVVNLMELDFGVRLAKARDSVERPDLDLMMQAAQAYDHRPIEKYVVHAYSEMRVRLAMRFLPNRVKQLGKLGEIERWRNEVTNELLHVEEGDMWLAAQAIVADLTLVTLEPKFVRFQEVTHPNLTVHLLG
jgi:predicted nucleic acid-binding protein